MSYLPVKDSLKIETDGTISFEKYTSSNHESIDTANKSVILADDSTGQLTKIDPSLIGGTDIKCINIQVFDADVTVTTTGRAQKWFTVPTALVGYAVSELSFSIGTWFGGTHDIAVQRTAGNAGLPTQADTAKDLGTASTSGRSGNGVIAANTLALNDRLGIAVRAYSGTPASGLFATLTLTK